MLSAQLNLQKVKKISKNILNIKSKTLALLFKLGRKIMEAHVRAYTKLNDYLRKQQTGYVAAGLGLIPWIKAHPLLTVGGSYVAWKLYPYFTQETWFSWAVNRSSAGIRYVGDTVTDTLGPIINGFLEQFTPPPREEGYLERMAATRPDAATLPPGPTVPVETAEEAAEILRVARIEAAQERILAEAHMDAPNWRNDPLQRISFDRLPSKNWQQLGIALSEEEISSLSQINQSGQDIYEHSDPMDIDNSMESGPSLKNLAKSHEELRWYYSIPQGRKELFDDYSFRLNKLPATKQHVLDLILEELRETKLFPDSNYKNAHIDQLRNWSKILTKTTFRDEQELHSFFSKLVKSRKIFRVASEEHGWE